MASTEIPPPSSNIEEEHLKLSPEIQNTTTIRNIILYDVATPELYMGN